MFSINKHSYLHNYCKDVSPGLINRAVDRAWDNKIFDQFDAFIPLNRLTSEQPCIPAKNVDVTRRPLAFGRSAIAKLRRELNSKDLMIVIAALESLCDLVVDAEKAFEAINLKVVDRLMCLLCHEDPIIRERANRTLANLVRVGTGREAVISSGLLANIATCIEDEFEEVRIQAAAFVEMLARVWTAADALISADFVQVLLGNLLTENKKIAVFHLQTLQSLMYGMHGKKEVLDGDGFTIFMNLLDDEENLVCHNVIAETLFCLGLLTSTCMGEKISRDVKLLRTANTFLHYEVPEVYTNAAYVIMFCTVITIQKIEAATMPSLVKRLIVLSRNALNRTTQIYAIKALTNVCEHPEVRKKVRKEYSDVLEAIQVAGDKEIEKYKEILLGIIGWVSFSST